MFKGPWYAAVLFLCVWDTGLAETSEWRIAQQSAPVAERQLREFGRQVCGEPGYELVDSGLRCKRCPPFTGESDSDEGLAIVAFNRGRFTGAGPRDEWLLDTQGCEAHFENFGGAMLLGAPETGSPTPAAPLEVVYYRPGYRLNDCVPFDNGEAHTLLVCNEYDITQGEIVGFISAMEVTRRDITRWRLLRWYDNTGTEMARVVSIAPQLMERAKLDGGEVGLRIQLRLVDTDRAGYERASEPQGKTIDLLFQRQGQRFFATRETQSRLSAIGELSRALLD